MKTRNPNSRGLAACSSNLFSICMVTFYVLAAGQAIAQDSWNGGGATANWSTTGNWADDTPPTGGALTFSGITQFVTHNDLAALTAFDAISFGNNGTTGQDASFTLAGNSITLCGNITTTAPGGGPPAGITMISTISLDLVLAANSAFVPSRNATTLISHTLAVSGKISGPFDLAKTGNANLSLSNSANSFTGSFTVNGNNDITVASIQPSGSNSSIGAGTSINLGNGNLIINGNVATSGNINRTINLTSLATSIVRLDNSNATAANSLVFDGPLNFFGTSGTTTLGLGGSNAGANEFKPVLANGTGTNVTALTKTGASNWIVSGNNTYTGLTSMENGTLNVSTIADSGSSNIGFGTNMRIGFGNSTGNLNFTGSGASTARQVRIGFFSGSNGLGGATINATGVNGGTGLKFTNTTFNDQSTTSPGTSTNRTLTLGGGNTDTNEIAGVIQNGATSNLPTLLTKSGAGRWILDGANLYAGATSVNGGVLQLNHATAIPGGITSAALINSLTINGGILGLGNGDFTRSLGTGAGQVSITGASGGFAAYGADRVVNLGAAGTPVQWIVGGFFNSGSNSMALSHATATHSVDFQNPIDLNNFARTIIVANGAANVDAILSGALSSSAGTPALTKDGLGTLMLSGVNTYGGNLNILAGSVKLGGASGTVIPNTSTVQLGTNSSTTSVVFDINGNSETIGPLSIGGATGGNPSAAGLMHSIVNTGASANLTLNGVLNYFAGAANQNGQATISANIDTGASNRNLIIADSTSTPVDLQISGVISGTGNGFNKAGPGVLMISGENTYTGPTFVSAGTLKLGANNSLPDLTNISIGTATLDGVTFTDTAGTLDVIAPATINLGSGSAIGFAASNGTDWAGGTLNITGTFLSGSSIRFGTTASGLTGTQLGFISINGVPGSYTLSPTGYLVNVAADPYLTWAGPGVTFDGDANMDGVNNGLAWLLGATNPDVYANNLLPIVAQTTDGLQMTFSMLNAASSGAAVLDLQHSSDLGLANLWTSITVPASSGPAGGVAFTITPAGNKNNVVATIPSSESASGKLFGRLKAVK
jgi:fibronectin-binding autotransporter adhesin